MEDSMTPSRRLPALVLLSIVVTALAAPPSAAGQGAVRAWEEQVTLPSYRLGPADLNPMFYTGASYQGAQRRIYPYPLMDHLTSQREEETFTALYLENEYVKLSILPEIGGRLFSAVDKTNGYDFFYRQHVIKPALIGMLGAWISGGVEWCVFHHHRNTTHMPVDYAIIENPDGSKTIWFGETERRHRMRWIIGITLRPGKSYLEATVKMFNRTAQPHSILYWANVAVHVNDDYQVIFPPSTQVATYHAKNDFVHWPIGRGRYHGHDYTDVDLSWWKNHPRSVSCFAWDLQEDFMGGYDHGKQAGVVHVGNHHVVCGAKLWEWAPGSIWDTQVLTDADGPYAELMVGAFSDNQPDYSWIKPYEVKTFKQCWYPIRDIGGFKKANLDAAVNLQLQDGKARVGFHVTSEFQGAKASLTAGERILFDETVDVAPAQPFRRQVAVPARIEETDLNVSLATADGRTLIAYRPAEHGDIKDLPDVVTPPPAPKEIETIEQLYLTGLRIEQIHNPSVDPLDYYEEALRRDPDDSRTNTIVGVNYNKRGLYAKAEEHLRRAVARVSAEYTRPGNTEAHYQLGLALKGQGRFDEAYDAFYRATWDYAFHSAGYCQLAALSCRRGEYRQALEQIDRALATNGLNTKALNVKAAILRRLGRPDEAGKIAQNVLSADPLDLFALNELHLALRESGSRAEAEKMLRPVHRKTRRDAQPYLELAADYMECGFWDEAISVLSRPLADKSHAASTHPMVHYYLGYLHEQNGQHEKAAQYYASAARMPSDYCLPFRLESIGVLEAALEADPNDARAYYYLGNLLYDVQPERAVSLWRESIARDDTLAIVHRNLGWAASRLENDPQKAIAHYEKALSLMRDDARHYLELDDLYERANTPPERRLAMLERNERLVQQRKPLLIRQIALLTQVGQYQKAIDLLADNQFYVSEGGGRELHDAYVDAHLLRGLEYARQGNHDKALEHFQRASEYPDNLALERPQNDRRAPQVAYYTAIGLAATGRTEEAMDSFRKSARQEVPADWLEARYYQLLSLRKLGRTEESDEILEALIASGARGLAGDGQVDFFAKFGEQETRQTRRADAHYVLGLGLVRQGQVDEAKNQFEQAINYNAGHTWARHQLSELNRRE
jgi:tetratricopeptide (TPR) repeat protein